VTDMECAPKQASTDRSELLCSRPGIYDKTHAAGSPIRKPLPAVSFDLL
jgi:hypothetical protein